MAQTRVVNVRDLSLSVEHELNVLRIGPGTDWANPYGQSPPNGPESTIGMAKYVLYLAESPDLQRAIPSLQGRILGCDHAGRCHGDVLAALADGREALPELVLRAQTHLWRHRIDPAFFWVLPDIRPLSRHPEVRELRGGTLQFEARYAGSEGAEVQDAGSEAVEARQMALAG